MANIPAYFNADFAEDNVMSIFVKARPRAVCLLIVLMVLIALVMIKVELPLLLHYNLAWENKIEPYRYLLHAHAFFAFVALVAAPLQFFTDLRLRFPVLHRRLGRSYVLSIMVSAPIAIYIAATHMPSDERFAVAAQGVLWLCCTLLALYFAIEKQIYRHKIWMARSYGLTLTFVISRLLVDVLHVPVNHIAGGNALLVWAMTLMVILAADLMTRRIGEPLPVVKKKPLPMPFQLRHGS